MPLESFEIARVLVLSAVSFLVAVLAAPGLISTLTLLKIGKRVRDEASAPVMARLHVKKNGTPTMGGILMWGTVLVLVSVFAFLDWFFPSSFLSELSFLNRRETWLPLAALFASAVVGLLDDWYNVRGMGGGKGGGLRVRHRLLLYTGIALAGAWWFSVKLGWDLLHVPFFGDFTIGWWYVPFFILVIVATSFSVNETDGLDGLAGAPLMTSFGALAVIAFAQGKYDLAAFCAVILGSLLAFLWFNVHPARFFMGDTGAMSLGVTLGVVAMLTNTALLLPVFGFLFVVESLSLFLQIFWRKVFHKKLFLSSPIHHHLEAVGWQEPQIVMRFWLISMVAAALGIALALLDALAT